MRLRQRGSSSLLPYIEQPVLDLGFGRIEAFPVLVGLAIIVQFQLVMRRAPSFGIDRKTASTLLAWSISLGIVGAHVFEMIAYQPDQLRQSPLELLRVWGGLSSFGDMVGGLLGVYVVMRARNMPATDMLRFADCLVYALPFTLAVGRLGCALQHDHPGIASNHWLAVDFPGTPRFDLGLLEFFYVAILALLFAILGRRRRPNGFFIGLFFVLYGPVRFALDSLRISEARYLGWTPGQYLALALASAGLVVLVAVLGKRSVAPV